MSFEAVRSAIATRLATITLPFPVEWEGGMAVGRDLVWGRWTIQHGEVLPAVLGPGHERGIGMVVLQIFMPEGQGTRPATQAADTLSTSLDRAQIRTGPTVITFDLVSMTDTGRREGYAQKNCWCKFTRDTYQ